VAVVATEPLTRDEVWHQGTPGSLWVFSGGVLRATLPSGEADKEPRTRGRAAATGTRRAA